MRTSGQLVRWQERLRHYPNDLASTRIEDAALKWGGFHAAGLLTLLRPGERLALLEWIVDDAARVVRIIFALNCVWQPTSKRARRSDRSIAPQACRSGRADRGGATGIRSPPCAPHHDCTSVGNARTRARRAERQPGAKVAPRRPIDLGSAASQRLSAVRVHCGTLAQPTISGLRSHMRVSVNRLKGVSLDSARGDMPFLR